MRDNTFWIDQIEKTKALILVYTDAMTTLGTGAQSYTIDTGQDRQTVTRADLDHLKATYDGLLNQLATLEARVYGCGVVQVRPAW